MNGRSLRPWLFAALLGLTAPIGAIAGTTCEQRQIGPQEIQNAMQMAHKTRQALEASGAQVAILGRVGSNLAEHGLRYSHGGYVLRDHPAGRGTVVPLLNTCADQRSDIFDEGLVNFFLDDLYAFEAAVIVPSKPLQERLARALSGPLPRALHNPEYNMIANPFNTRYQNSNQWMLEILATALAPEHSTVARAQAQAVLMQRRFTADPIRIGTLQRLGASITRANVRFDDHDQQSMSRNEFPVVTVRSIARFVDAVDTPVAKIVIPLEGNPAPATRF